VNPRRFNQIGNRSKSLNLHGRLISYRQFVAPTLIKIVYWLGLIGIAIGILLGLGQAAGAMQYDAASALGGLIIALVGGAAAVLTWRVVCEVWIVLFTMNDRLGQLVDRGKM
jgi:hypothetical protein